MSDILQKRIGRFLLHIDCRHCEAVADAAWHRICRSLFNDGDGVTVLKKGRYKTIMISRMPDGESCIAKKYTEKGMLRKLKATLRGSRAQREFAAAQYVRSAGIPTPAPLFVAEKTAAGLVTESIVGFCYIESALELKDLFFEQDMQPQQRWALAESFGRLTADIVKSGIFQSDYSLNNFIGLPSKEGIQLFFIDFERVCTGGRVPLEDRLLLMAKLNRVGRQVCGTDRLRFLRGYRSVDPEIGDSIRRSARAVQEKYIELLRRDLQRGRMTSLYTHAQYERISQRGYKGLCRKGFDCSGLLNRLSSLQEQTAGGLLAFGTCGEKAADTFCITCTADRARALWTIISTCVIAGAPCGLPRAVVDDGFRGWLLLSRDDRQALLQLDSYPPGVSAFIKEHFSREYYLLRDALR